MSKINLAMFFRPGHAFPMKTCVKCSLEKPLSEFYYNSRLLRYSSYCKTCTVAVSKDWSASNKTRKNDINRGWRQRHKPRRQLMMKATNALWAAIRKGHIVRGTVCENCGSEDRIQAAHSDYSMPLTVTWLCISCHRTWDAKFPKSLKIPQEILKSNVHS